MSILNIRDDQITAEWLFQNHFARTRLRSNGFAWELPIREVHGIARPETFRWDEDDHVVSVMRWNERGECIRDPFGFAGQPIPGKDFIQFFE